MVLKIPSHDHYVLFCEDIEVSYISYRIRTQLSSYLSSIQVLFNNWFSYKSNPCCWKIYWCLVRNVSNISNYFFFKNSYDKFSRSVISWVVHYLCKLIKTSCVVHLYFNVTLDDKLWRTWNRRAAMPALGLRGGRWW